MSFLNPDKDNQGAQKIHVRSYSWSGGEKYIDPNDPAAGKKAYPEIRYYEGSGQSTVKGKGEVPMKIAVLGTTFQVTGFTKKKGEGSEVSYFSNETVAWGQEMVVLQRDAQGIREVARGTYDDVKRILGDNVKCQTNAYFYNMDRKCIDRFCFKNSAYGEFSTYKKSVRREIYTNYTCIDTGKLENFPTGPSYLPKIYRQDGNYTPEELEEITEAAKEYEEYENYLAKSGEKSAQDEYNQTPSRYEGEGSQELPDAPVEDNGEEAINLSDIPF